VGNPTIRRQGTAPAIGEVIEAKRRCNGSRSDAVRDRMSSRAIWLLSVGVAFALGIVSTSLVQPVTTPSPKSNSGVPAAGGRAARDLRGPSPQRMPQWAWWRDRQVQKALELTPTQIAALEQIYESRRIVSEPFLEAQLLQRELLNKMTTEATATAEHFSLEAARFHHMAERLGESRTIMLYRMRLVLSAAQVRALDKIEAPTRPNRPER
jgi:hypothetical protein